MSQQAFLWLGFCVLVVTLLVLDLGVFHRKSHTVSIKEALVWSAVWISLALLFNIGVYFWRDADSALAFLTGYLLEKSLSVDNLFVFLLIFSYFSVPLGHQHKVLFWGILGALVVRAIMISVGVVLLHTFHWLIYIFGGFLIITGYRMAFRKDEAVHPESNPVVRLFRRVMPVTTEYHGDRFFVRQGNRLAATPLFIVLLIVEATDVVFAVDSIPAILAITRDPFIVYTSNVFAILGLRSLFFALAGIMDLFHYLKVGLAIVLIFIGAKMVLSKVYPVPIQVALLVVTGILALSIVVSWLWPPAPAVESPDTEDSTAVRGKERH